MSDYPIDPDLPAKLERLALRAETSKTYVQEFRMMRAEGVADILYEALFEIKRHRGMEDD